MKDKPILILIGARGGSTRVNNKNLRLLAGKPLIAHTIEAAVNSKIGRVVVSTDSREIAEVAQEYGAEVPFMPAQLATATASSVDVIHHALAWFINHQQWKPVIIAFCPPTNPFRSATTIKEMYKQLESHQKVNSIVTITKPTTHPFRIIQMDSNGLCRNGVVSIDGKTINDIERSQDWPQVWEGSPACRMTRSDFFLQRSDHHQMKTYDTDNFLGYEISSIEATDIDVEDDFVMAELSMSRLKEKIS
jgi:CMP-N-acetylneuraminic acid synthetase